ncbi:MAG TPA: ABC transporter permease [Longimicrobium sp.]|jgi:predicted permease
MNLPARWRLPVSLLDVKLGARMLLKHPLMTVVSVISLAVGIPVGLAPRHVIDAVEAPLPVEEGERVLALRHVSVETLGGAPSTYFDYSVWKGALRGFQGLAAVRMAEYSLDPGTGTGAPVSGAAVTSSAFQVLRASPQLGRTLRAEDDLPGAPPVVVIGHDVWRSRFDGDPGVVGRGVKIGGVMHTVVGVMPAAFLFPVRQQMWLPLRERPASEPGRSAALQVFGRLADGVSPEAAQTEVDVVRRRMAAEFPDTYGRLAAEAVPFAIAIQGLPRGGWLSDGPLWFIQGLAITLLAVACVNVGLLIFARTATRAAELAVRAALGAGRARIVGQVFVEALVLAVVSTAVGLLLVELLANRLLGALWSPAWGGVPWWIDLGVTGETVAKAMLLAVFSAALASIVPAMRVTGKQIQEPLRRAAATGSGVRVGIVSGALILADMALAVAAVGLVAGSSEHLARMKRPEMAGLPAGQFLSAEITLADDAVALKPDAADSAAWVARVAGVQQRLVDRLQAEPGVRGVAVAEVLPRMDHPWGIVEVQGGVRGDRDGGHEVEQARVALGFFEALGQPVLAGRGFNAADLGGDRRAVVVNRRFAETTLRGRSAVGRQIRYLSVTDGKPGPWYEIVGVVPDLGTNLTEPQNGLGVYHPAAPGEIYPLRLAVHVGPDPTSFAPRLRELLAQAAPAATVVRAEPLDRVFPEAWYGLSGLRLGWSVFVGILLVLAASGVYTVMAFGVAQRTREIGIRAALGARPAQIAATIGWRAAAQVGVGALVGMPMAGFIYRAILPYTTTTEGVFFVAIAPGVLAMLLVGILACTAPLLRALRITPTEAMREA